MALLSRLHWWTVEYGLIGPLDKPKIYGAGLLSSIGESVSCLEPNVKKIPYSIDAENVPFDITTKQPQLFVTRDFQQLGEVLEEFASKMAFRVGGLEGITKSIECKNTATCEYSSGLQVSGGFTEVITHEGDAIYLHDWRQRARVQGNKELPSTVAIITRKVLARRSAIGKATDKVTETLTDEELTSSELQLAKTHGGVHQRRSRSMAGSKTFYGAMANCCSSLYKLPR